VAVLFVGASHTAQGSGKKELAFGALESMSAETAQAKAQEWLKAEGKTDAATTQKLQSIWKDENRAVLDRLADSFGLGCAQCAKIMADARDPGTLAPATVPAVLKDAKCSMFMRANVGLAYARALANRKFHDEAMEVLKLFQVEQVAAPATFLFTRAVCEHALLQKADASRSIVRLLEEGVNTPERYRTVSALMLLDMQTWKEKDLAAIARKMKMVEDRLEIAKGGPETQKIQKNIVDRLDELIKEEENKAKNQNKPGDPKPGGG
jgi:hypothetical protein